MTERTRRRVRAGLVYLTVSFLVVGLRATLRPSSFYGGFPGGGRHWVAGAGLTTPISWATSASAPWPSVWFCSWPQCGWIRVVQAASGAVMVNDAAHLRHPNETLESLDIWMSNGGLAFGMIIALLILVTVSRAGANPDLFAAASPGGTSRTSPKTPRAQLSGAIPINKEES